MTNARTSGNKQLSMERTRGESQPCHPSDTSQRPTQSRSWVNVTIKWHYTPWSSITILANFSPLAIVGQSFHRTLHYTLWKCKYVLWYFIFKHFICASWFVLNSDTKIRYVVFWTYINVHYFCWYCNNIVGLCQSHETGFAPGESDFLMAILICIFCIWK